MLKTIRPGLLYFALVLGTGFLLGFVLRRYAEVRSPRRSLLVGILALLMSVCAELGLAVVLQDQTLSEFIASRDKVSGSVYLALLLAFAVMPRIRLHGDA